MLQHRWYVLLLCSRSNRTNNISISHTQDKIGCFITDRTDKIIVPGMYETAEQQHDRIMEKVCSEIPGLHVVTNDLRPSEVYLLKKSALLMHLDLVVWYDCC